MPGMSLLTLFTFTCFAAGGMQLEGHVEQLDNRPVWIPAYAYTNDELVGSLRNKNSPGCPLHDGVITRNDKESKTDKYWTGKKYRKMRMISWSIPGHPGNFHFFTLDHSDGPRGWYQDTGEFDKNGYRLYRIWLDQ